MATARGGVPLNQLWGPIQAGVSRRENVGQLWSRVRSALGIPGGQPTGVTRQQFTGMVQTAVSMRKAGDWLGEAIRTEQATGITQPITAQGISPAPWSRPLGDRQVMPRYQINFLTTLVAEDGSETQQWLTTYTRGALPPTAGEIWSLVNADAEKIVGRYQEEFGGVADIQILTI